MLDLGIGTYLKVGAAIAIIAVVGLGYWRCTDLESQVAKKDVTISELTKSMVEAVTLANNNAAEVLKADAERKAAVDALETANAETSRQAESAIAAAPASDDGPVAPLLETLRKTRFGGKK